MRPLERVRAELKENDRQWEAFTSIGHCVVLAPPGSGKTKLLTARLGEDLLSIISPPRGAACVTLTNAAADELRRRIDSLGVGRRSTLFVGTVHSFALNSIVLPFAQAAGEPSLGNVRVATRAQQDKAFSTALRETYSHCEDVRYVRSTLERCRKLAHDDAWYRAGEAIRHLNRCYTELLRAQGVIDFDGIVEAAVDLVERHAFVRQTLVARYPRIFVDEYQDLAPGLHRLVKALCFDYRRQAELFAVGDPDQAIFGWTGTRPELLEQLTEEPGVTTVRLEINYRCGEEIIRLSQRALTVDRKIRGVRAGGKARAQHCPGGYGDQSRTAADLICTAMEDGTPLHEIAVLCPTNANCRETAEHFTATGIPAYVRGSEYEQTAITSLIETAAAWALFGEHGEDQRLGDVLRQWRWLLDDQADRQIDVAFTEALLRYRDRADAPVVDIIQALTEVGLGLTLDRASRSEEKRALTSMWSALEVGGPLQGMTLANLANRARRTDRVEVTTMSSSKGLEFDLVIMLGADEGRMPFFATLSRPKELAEERRKFYVSLTRARREIVALYSGFVEWRDGWRRYHGPSRFLRQVGLA